MEDSSQPLITPRRTFPSAQIPCLATDGTDEALKPLTKERQRLFQKIVTVPL
jgi:hypothetical protein